MSRMVFPLGFLKNGQAGIVKDLLGGTCMHRRLAEMGLVRGTKIKVIKNDQGGPLIISIGEERLAIGRGASWKIMVEENA